MNKIIVKNLSALKGQQHNSDGGVFTYKPVIAPTSPDASQCHIAFVEVLPGDRSFPYHYHEMDEEVFYIISGEGVVRTPEGELNVKTGDVIVFPSGPAGAHSIRNDSETETLIYIDFDTHNLPEITHFPDTGKVAVAGPFSDVIYDANQCEENRNPRRKKGLK